MLECNECPEILKEGGAQRTTLFFPMNITIAREDRKEENMMSTMMESHRKSETGHGRRRIELRGWDDEVEQDFPFSPIEEDESIVTYQQV